MKRRVFLPAGALALFVASAVVACKSTDPTPAPAPSASAVANEPAEAAAPADSASAPASAAASAEPPRPPIPRNAGHAGLLLGATRSLDLRDPEKTKKLDDIAKSFGEGDGTRDEGKAISDELAAQVKAGKIDNTKLEPLYAALEKAAKEAHDKQVVALDGIYAALGPLERKTMVENIRKKTAARDAHDPKGHDAGAPSPADERKRLVEQMTKNLSLDEAQAKKVEPLVPVGEKKKLEDIRDEERKHLDALLTAFEKDGFSAKTLPFRDPKKLRGPFQDQARFYGAFLPILKPEQREKLASNMAHRGGHGRPGHPMKPGPHGPHGWGDSEP